MGQLLYAHPESGSTATQDKEELPYALCPTLYAVLMDEDKDNVIQLRHKNEKAFESGLGVICKVDGDTPILALRDKPILDKVTMLVNKVIDIYNELNANPPFPSWKEGLGDLWN